MTDGFYRVHWLKGERELGRHAFDNLLAAKAFASERLRIQKIRKGADRARVIDADGVPYFESEV